MTAEQKVKQVYPNATVYDAGNGRAAFNGVGGKQLGDAQLHVSWAWADAWRHIEAERKEAGK